MAPTDISDSALLTAYDLLMILQQVASDETMEFIESAVAKTEQEIQIALEARGYHLVCQRKGEVSL